MKRLICAGEVKVVAQKGQKTFCIDKDTIITPAARDIARENDMKFILDAVATEESTVKAEKHDCVKNDVSKAVQPKQEINKDLLYEIVKKILTNKLLSTGCTQLTKQPFEAERDAGGLKVVRGKTVTMEKFDTGDASTNVAYREVISKDESQMSAGFLTIDKSTFEWELFYEEIDVILEGSLSIAVNGKTYYVHQGDVLFIPNGSKVTWSSAEHAKLFYTTYPANWADLMEQQ